MTVINQKIVDKVWSVVGKGLSCGLGERKPGHMCVEAAVCYALDEPHGDEPTCVHHVIRSFKINLNDISDWGTNKQRGDGMRRIAIAQLGSLDLDENKWTDELVKGFRRLLKQYAPKKPASTEKAQLLGEVTDYIKQLQQSLASIKSCKDGNIRQLAYNLPDCPVEPWGYGDDDDSPEGCVAEGIEHGDLDEVPALFMDLPLNAIQKRRLLNEIAEMAVQVCFKCKTEGVKFLERY